MNPLATNYLGLELRSPIVASSGPVTARLDLLKRLDSAGAGAVVLPSLFEEEIAGMATELHLMFELNALSNPEALNFFPEIEEFKTGPERYVELIEAAKRCLSIPVIASLNATSAGGWSTYASELERAGADALELNIYIIGANPERSQDEIEQAYISIVRTTRSSVSIPLAIKVAPHFTSLASTASALVEAGADGLVLFNRFYQPDIDIKTRDVSPEISLSSPAEIRLPLRWIAMLHGRIGASLALSTGIHSSADVAKALLVGADVAMSTSALILNGPEHVRALESGLLEWMDEHEYESVTQLRGSASYKTAADPSAFERANYVETIRRYSSPFARKFGL